MNRQRFLLPALLALTVARLLFLPLYELSSLEQHVVQCTQRESFWQPAMASRSTQHNDFGGSKSIGFQCSAQWDCVAWDRVSRTGE